jgi:hypothetical protein
MTVASRLAARQRRFMELCRGLSLERENVRTTGTIPFRIEECRDYRDRLAKAIHALEGARQVLVRLNLRLNQIEGGARL